MLPRYVYLNHDPVHDWTLYQTALKATDEIMYYLCNRLKRHSDGTVCFALYQSNEHRVTNSLQQISLGGAADMLVTLITSNVQNDGFIAKALALASAEHVTLHTLAYNIFAETVPSALLFSTAISSVVDYYADPSRKDELQKLIQLSTATGDDTDHALMRFIAPVLGRSLAACHLTLEAHEKAARRQDVSSINQ